MILDCLRDNECTSTFCKEILLQSANISLRCNYDLDLLYQRLFTCNEVILFHIVIFIDFLKRSATSTKRIYV